MEIFLTPRTLHLAPSAAQAALSTILIIGGVIMLFGISLALIALSFSNSTIGYNSANRALALATGGVKDAELQLLRNASTSDAGYCVPAASTPCPSGYAQVTITQSSPSAGQVTVTSDATVNLRRRKILAVYSVSATTTQLTPLTFTVLTQ